jgi:hypothetical protein
VLGSWHAHVAVNTHAPPERYIWQGPQFRFKTYRTATDNDVRAHGHLVSHT